MNQREFLWSKTREWLDRAHSDLRACRMLMAELPSESLFHAQQCAEKALKAFLTWHQTPFNKTHDLKELRWLSQPFFASMPHQLEKVDDLTKYAWRFRYPGAPYTPDSEEAEEAMHLASEVLDSIASILTVSFESAPNENSQG